MGNQESNSSDTYIVKKKITKNTPMQHPNQKQPLQQPSQQPRQQPRQQPSQQQYNQQMNGTIPITFNGQDGYDSEIRYGSDSDSGYGFKIEITTDMKLPRY